MAEPEEGETEDGVQTTMFLRGLPPGLRKNDLVGVLEDEGFAGAFDFVYLLANWETFECSGEAIVNFRSADDADGFRTSFAGFDGWPPHALVTAPAETFVAEVELAKGLQGLDNCVERHRNSGVMHAQVPEEFKPLLLGPNGESLPFPMPTKKLKAPRRMPPHVWEDLVGKGGGEEDFFEHPMAALAGEPERCAFFDKGKCKFGAECRNAHLPAARGARGKGAAPPVKGAPVPVKAADTRNVCQFFLKGECKFGGHCRNSHAVEEESSAAYSWESPAAYSWERPHESYGKAAYSWDREPSAKLAPDDLAEQVRVLSAKVREVMLATLDGEVQAALNSHWDQGFVSKLLDGMVKETTGIRDKSAYVYSRLAKAPPALVFKPPASKHPLPAAGSLHERVETRRRIAEASSPEEATTLFITGLPRKLTRADFVELLLDHSGIGNFDFAYLITNFEDLSCDGKGVVNFRTAQQASEFVAAFAGFREWPPSSLVDGDTTEYIAGAEAAKGCQGLDNCIERHRNAGIMHEAIPEEYRPQLFDEEGIEEPFPAPTKPLRLPRRLPKHVAQSLSAMNGVAAYEGDDQGDQKRRRTSEEGDWDQSWAPPPTPDSAGAGVAETSEE